MTVDGLWAPPRRGLTVGLALATTPIAAEALAVATIMPRVARELGGPGIGLAYSPISLLALREAPVERDRLGAGDEAAVDYDAPRP